MRRLALLAVVAACGDDPSLHVSVKHPTDQRIHDAIRRTLVTVYESDSLSCSDVEFGDLTEDELFALETAEVETTDRDSTGTFSGVSRLDHKVIVARGFGIADELIAAGCVEIDDVESGTANIETVPAAIATVTADAGGMGAILVTTTDPFSRPLNGRRVSWRTYGPTGTTANDQQYTNVDDGIWEPKSPSCTREGEVTIHPQPPRVPAGFGVRLRVSWAANEIPLFTRFNRFDTESQLFAPDAAIVRRCALRKTASAPATIVCLASRSNALDLRLANGVLASQAAPVSSAVAVVSVPKGDELDVYAIDDLGNWTALFGSTPASNSIPNPWCPGACGPTMVPTVIDLQVVPPCGSTPGVLLARVERGSAGTTEVFVQPLRGGGTTLSMTDAPLTAAGCLTELQTDGSSVIRQAVVFGEVESPPSPSFVTFPCEGSPSSRCTIPLGDGAAFQPGDEPRMMISALDATGTVLSSVVARPNESMTRDNLIERTRQPAAAPPQEMVFGQFDTDNDLDAFWYFPPPFGRNATSIQVAYAREVDDDPLTALDRFEGVITEAYTGNLDQDPRDEIMIVATRASLPSLHVIVMGSTVVDQTPADPPCP